ncbi:hypothetical protein KI809_16690 [Geobacter pelophilus]|uniref:Uncharacterized protein n=1 Tax=Geoanaerobacter pelophilus TaxID=60036 RepID=A0AAW4LBJ2_9BACT|nr:hypothetical protein [Geoanaerobacter pelophilus]MBT0665950.1 hypothetical protein [Geoanaerobacter pelophilus]
MPVIKVKASDLYYKYHKNTVNRSAPKFAGKPDNALFDRDDIYEILPMFSAVMVELERDDQQTLHRMEELMIRDMPSFIATREEVFDFLVNCMKEIQGR